MSTRSTTHFYWQNADKPEAIIYRHSDGYPEGQGSDLLAFIDALTKLKDNRFDDPCYLASKLVVFLARRFNIGYEGGGKYGIKDHPLDFLQVGIVMEDPGDIEYRYEVRCQCLGQPLVKCFKMEYSSDGAPKKGKAVKIPKPKDDDILRSLALTCPMSQAMELPVEETV